MVALSFSLFKNKLLSAEKTQTVRTPRKSPIKVGCKLQIYWKQRSPKESEKLFDAECTKVQSISINHLRKEVYLDNTTLSATEIEHFAQLDGFENSEDFFDYFGEFKGVVIHWKRLVTELTEENNEQT
ncbi:hypothetical protein [Lyngbya sp. PCC 8106]|uniref:hypothetical protein n=1 Tax=Lyngbya sp. (strain PCC 8106) TaxID=313612 RepID=UPI0000EA991D|nr:hypothetical protein [Lyngbya sp. PCC 8106]EAW35143.1 hypothetical protein L8106_13550 [Lyngbya sp. PCC 8106]